jgi:hypothetical protein
MRGDVAPDHPLRATRDHYIPKSKRREIEEPIIVIACFTCNQIKGDRFPEQWDRFMQRNPRWWEPTAVRPKAPPTKLPPLPIEHTKYILEHGKKAYRLWVADGCALKVELRPLRKDETIPKRYDDPKAQEAYERVYADRKWMLRVPPDHGA